MINVTVLVLNLLAFMLLALNLISYPFPYEVVLFFEHGVIRPRNSGYVIILFASLVLIINSLVILVRRKRLYSANIYAFCFLAGVCVSQILYAKGSYFEELVERYDRESSWGRYDEK